MPQKPAKIIFLFSLLCLALFLQAPVLQNNTTQNVHITGKGNPKHLLSAYHRWENNFTKHQQTETLTIPLQFAKAFSRNKASANGSVQINLLNGQVFAQASGLDSSKTFHLCLNGLLKSDPKKSINLDLGTFSPSANNQLKLNHQLDRFTIQDINLNRILLTETLADGSENIILAGTPGLFQRLYFSDKAWTIAGLNHGTKTQDLATPPFAFLLPKSAFAHELPVNVEDKIADLVAEGREIFKSETFAGNGRTCATCHRLDNNHTIDPKYIASLPADDPLFIAETNPELAGLENPKLLRQMGLILANVDGFDKFGVFRGVPHLFGMPTSITPEQEFEGQDVAHALGWSADGSVGDGSLRMFTIGAVIQHMPKTLARLENEDFRLPTDHELDALEAYMLSLGRTSDPELDDMFFSSSIVQRGRELFHSKEQGTGQCKGCHLNGGANSSSSLENGNRDTGVENMPDNSASLIWEPTPADGGFGDEEGNDCGINNDQTCYGNREFNMTTVIEAADTAPFFHNNSVSTIEEAVAFYNSDAFHNSPGANPADPGDPESVCERCIHMEPTQIVSIALFLRTLNAMENIRSSNELDSQTINMDHASREERKELITIAMAETEDAIEVLEGGAIIPYAESINLLKQALKAQKFAFALQRVTFSTRIWKDFKNYLNLSISLKQQANSLMLEKPDEQEANI